MTTTMLNSLVSVTKEIGDFWDSTTTGAGSATTLVDVALLAKADDWITDGTYVLLTSEPAGAAAIYDERKVSSLASSTGTLTTLTFAAAPGTGITYMLTRLFSPSDYRRALVRAAKDSFPYLFAKVRNESKRFGNWLIDGSFESWSSTSALTYWTASTTTLTQTSTARMFTNGSYSCKLSGGAGYVGQSIANNDDLKYLRGKTVILKGRGWSDTASSLRMAIYDGTTLTYSDYHPAGSAWDDETDTWEISATISSTATEVAFRAYHDNAAANDYVEEFRVTSGDYDRVLVSDLSMAQDYPIKVSWCPSTVRDEEWIPIRQFEHGGDGYIYISDNVPVDSRLRIEGTGYLDFLASGVASTAWTATIAVDEPQLQILTAQTILYLCQQMIAPNFTSGDTNTWVTNYNFWKQELATRKTRYGMKKPTVRVVWTV